jgi:hypothetical protein
MSSRLLLFSAPYYWNRSIPYRTTSVDWGVPNLLLLRLIRRRFTRAPTLPSTVGSGSGQPPAASPASAEPKITVRITEDLKGRLWIREPTRLLPPPPRRWPVASPIPIPSWACHTQHKVVKLLGLASTVALQIHDDGRYDSGHRSRRQAPMRQQRRRECIGVGSRA